MKNFFSDNWIVLSIAVFITTSIALAIRNDYHIDQDQEQLIQTYLVKRITADIERTTLNAVDLAVRGFALTKDKSMLASFQEATGGKAILFKQLDSLLLIQNYADREMTKAVEEAVNQYIEWGALMIAEERKELSLDKTTAMTKKYSDFALPLIDFEDHLGKEASAHYQAAMRTNMILHIVLLTLTLPLLNSVLTKIRRVRESSDSLLAGVENNDRQYVFNTGKEGSLSAKEIHESTGRHLREASSFIKSIAHGEYNVDWKGWNADSEKLNQSTLAGNLLDLRERLKTLKLEDEKRNWINKGLAEFSDTVRSYQHDAAQLADGCISFLTKYLNAQQGSLFVVEGEEDDRHLNLAGCYAFDRKKWVQKRVELDAGLVGQAYLEGDVIQLKEIPQGYTKITSGLGEATPRFLVIVPMKVELQTIAVVELAAFYDFEEHHIAFLRKAGEFLASAILNSKTTIKMQELLEKAVVTEKQMHQSEEEMRQNMEELSASQEEMQRKNNEIERLFNLAQEKEQILESKLEEIQRIKREEEAKTKASLTYMQNYKKTLLDILDQLPHKVFLKDHEGKMVLVNTIVAKAHNMSIDELIGKSDFDFVDAKTAREWRNQELEIIKKGSETYIFDETLGSETKTMKSTKMSFYISHLDQVGLLGIQTDITELQKLKSKASLV